MQFQNNYATLISYLSSSKRSKLLPQIISIFQTIPSLYKMLRIKGPAVIKQLILKSNLITLSSSHQILNSSIQFPTGFHLLLQGTISIYSLINLRNQEKQLRSVGTLTPGVTFGYTRQFQNYTINKLVTQQKCTIFKLSVNDMYKLLDGVFIFPELVSRLEQLMKIPVLKQLDKKDLLKIVEHSTKVLYPIHQTIFKEGDQIKNLLMLEKGEVQLYKVGQRRFRKQKFIDKLPICILVTPGDLLGMTEMMENQTYKCYAQATSSDCVLTQVPKHVILALLKDVKEEEPKQFKIQSKSRDKRVHTMIEFSERMNKKQEMNQIKRGRLCFQEKEKIMNPQKSATTRSTYISNKFNDRVLFENEEEFYCHKIKKMEKLAVNKYGKEFKAKFIRLFGNDFLPPKKITKDMLMKKSARTYGNLNSARENTESQERQRANSCRFFRMKKKIVDEGDSNRFTKTMQSWM